MHDAPTLLTGWQNFYVVVGSAAAGLTGLQFVVIALSAQLRQQRTTAVGIDAFSTPTIVYFSTVLLLSAGLCAPWKALQGAAALLAVVGAAGILYTALVARRAIGQTGYRLVLEDWLWHITFPIVAQVTLLAAGLCLLWHPTAALFTTAAAVLFLLAIGIHNAWDTATYMVTERLEPQRPESGSDQHPAE